MTDRVVVCVRTEEAMVAPAAYLAAARTMTEQAAAHGADLIAWGATTLAFELDPEAVQDVIELALSVMRDAPDGTERSVGISEGPLERAEDATLHVAIAWGPPLVRATALARAAHPGEILLDPLLSSVKRGDLTTHGARVGLHGRERVRGLLLDALHPFRTAHAGGAPSVARSPLIGRPELSALAVPGGSLGIVRAGRGHGGTRFLSELEQHLEPARVLGVSPHPFGEPLGALRRALLRAVTMGQAPLNLTSHAGEGLDALLAGEGLDPDSGAGGLSIWLTPDSVQDPRGVVLLDDASEIDADTLEVVARAAATSGEPFRVVARLGESEPVPTSLASLPVAAEVRLGPLSQDDAVRLAVACTRGALDEVSALGWADRGSRLPLGIVESILGSMEVGEIVWEGGRAIARQRGAGTDVSGTPKHWVKRRLGEQAIDARRVLEAVSILGGQAETLNLNDVIRRKLGAAFDPSGAIAVLLAAGWVVRLKPDVLALPSATHRDAVLATLTDGEFRAWHRVASDSFRDRDRPLETAAATVHAILAGDSERALELARRASASIRAVGLEVTALAFERFAEQGDVAALATRNLFTAQHEMARAAPSVWPEARTSIAPEVAPAEPETTRSFSAEPAPPPAPRRSMPPPKPMRAKRPPAAPSAPSAPSAPVKEAPAPTSDVPVSAAAPPPASPVVPTPGPVPSPPRVSLRPPGGADGPPSAAVEALRKGDLEAVERMATHIRIDEGRTGLAGRLQAMAQLARGETGDAIRSLRDAADEARLTRSRDRCRTALALSVALASAGRHEEALIEALDALARARELSDERGEQACLRFLSRLAATAGHHDVAEAWTAGTPS